MANKSYKRETEIDVLNGIIEKAKTKGAIRSDIENHYFVDLYMMIIHRHIQNWYIHGMKWQLANTINKYFDFFWKVIVSLDEQESK
jgi:hypothetical protein